MIQHGLGVGLPCETESLRNARRRDRHGLHFQAFAALRHPQLLFRHAGFPCSDSTVTIVSPLYRNDTWLPLILHGCPVLH